MNQPLTSNEWTLVFTSSESQDLYLLPWSPSELLEIFFPLLSIVQGWTLVYCTSLPRSNEIVYALVPHDLLLLDSAPRSPIIKQCPTISYYWTVPLMLDHSYLVGNLTNSKIAETKALEPLKSWHFRISSFWTCWFPNEIWVVQD
jgi:hypothetical protein